MNPRPFFSSFVSGLVVRATLVAALLTGAAVTAAESDFVGPLAAGTIEGPPRKETSGLAVSRRAPEIVWTHDDSGGAPMLYAADLITGKKRGALRVTGVKNEDWEDVASFEKDGKAWLLIGDVGDNDAKRKTVRLHVVEEPPPASLKPDTVVDVAPSYTVRFRYSDGPRDCESIAVDPVEGSIYLLTKRDAPPRLYRLALSSTGDAVAEARLVSPLPDIVGATPMDALIKRIVGKKFSWPTGMDFSADGSTAVVLTYGEPLVFLRAAGEAWAEAFKRAPTRLLFHGLPQAEAVCFSADSRTIYVASEETNVLIRYNREEH